MGNKEGLKIMWKEQIRKEMKKKLEKLSKILE